MLNQVRIDTQQADALLACDLVVGASNDALQTVRRGRTRIVANAHEIQTAKFVHDPDANLHADALLAKMRFAAGADRVQTCDAQALAQRLLGDTAGANILLLGYAWQLGLVPVSVAALDRAIELNGVAVDANRSAFRLGRLAVADPQALAALAGETAGGDGGHEGADEGADAGATDDELEAIVKRRVAHLTAYQDASYAMFYRTLVDRVAAAERGLFGGAAVPLRLATTVARVYAGLLAYKDEYEVARLFTDGSFRAALEARFEGDYTLRFHMAPPLLARPDASGRPRKMDFGPRLMLLMKLLARGKALRGTALDLFGRTDERRMERELPVDYARSIEALLGRLSAEMLDKAVAFAALAEGIRGYGPVKLANLHTVKRLERALAHELGIDFFAGDAVARLIRSVPGPEAGHAFSRSSPHGMK
jgi:indolepyruvate ferredoxin oxidoreductase